MKIGIIGAGALGSSVARALAKVGIEATIANSRGPETLSDLVKDIGPTLKAVTLAEAAAADIVLIAVRWEDAERVLTCPAGMERAHCNRRHQSGCFPARG